MTINTCEKETDQRCFCLLCVAESPECGAKTCQPSRKRGMNMLHQGCSFNKSSFQSRARNWVTAAQSEKKPTLFAKVASFIKEEQQWALRREWNILLSFSARWLFIPRLNARVSTKPCVNTVKPPTLIGRIQTYCTRQAQKVEHAPCRFLQNLSCRKILWFLN